MSHLKKTEFSSDKCMMSHKNEKSQNEIYFEVLFNHPSIGVAVLDARGKILRANSCFQKMLGYTEQELQELSYLDITAEQDRDLSIQEHECSKAMNATFCYVKRYVRKNGDIIWVKVKATYRPHSSDPNLDFSIAVIEDCTKEQEQQLALERLQLQLTTIVESSSFGICTVDKNMKVMFANSSLLRMLGYSAEEFKTKTIRDLTHPADFVDTAVIYNDTKGGSSYQAIRRYLRKDGTYLWVKLTVTRFTNGLDGVYGMAFFEDISDQKTAEFLREEQQARMAHTAKMAALGEMAGGVAHEINTPLAAMGIRIEQILEILQSERVENPELWNQIFKGLSQVQSMVNRIANIVKGLRFFAREGQQDPMEKVKVSTLLEGTLDLCKERFASHAIPLSVNQNEDYISSEVECRPIEISQVLLNLLNNAFDAVQNLPDKWVRVEVANFAESIEISVTDSGPGIPKALREKIMQPFFTTKEIGKGTGLGLSISKGIIDQHGGKLMIDDQSPHTKLILSLPKFRKDPA